MNYLQTLDTNLVDDMIGVRVKNIRRERAIRNQFLEEIQYSPSLTIKARYDHLVGIIEQIVFDIEQCHFDDHNMNDYNSFGVVWCNMNVGDRNEYEYDSGFWGYPPWLCNTN